MKNTLVPSQTPAAHHDLRRACETLDALTTILDGLAVGIFTKTPVDAVSQIQAGAVARAVTRGTISPPKPRYDPVCTCKNCGKELKLSDTVSFYGIPACPVCVHAGKPFEVEMQSSETETAQSETDVKAKL
jgi:hypothetical protein